MFSLVFGRDTVHLQVHTPNRERKKSSGQTNLFNIRRTGAMDRTPVAMDRTPGDPLKTEGQAEPMY